MTQMEVCFSVLYALQIVCTILLWWSAYRDGKDDISYLDKR